MFNNLIDFSGHDASDDKDLFHFGEEIQQKGSRRGPENGTRYRKL
jgi:hypothetical protein